MPTRLALAAALLAPALALASEPANAMVRHGNLLIVTAPDGEVDSALDRRMRQKVTVDFVDSGIDEVAEFLRSTTGANIVLAPSVLAAAPRVTLKASGMTLGHLLRWVTTLTRTHAGVVHGALYISDQPVAGATRTRVYDISDLVMHIPDFPGPELAMTAGSDGAVFVPQQEGQSRPDHDEIVELLKQHVKPGSWRD